MKTLEQSIPKDDLDSITITQIIALSSAIEGLLVNTHYKFRQLYKQRFKRIKDDVKFLNRHFEEKFKFSEKDFNSVDFTVEIYQEALDAATLETALTMAKNLQEKREAK